MPNFSLPETAQPQSNVPTLLSILFSQPLEVPSPGYQLFPPFFYPDSQSVRPELVNCLLRKQFAAEAEKAVVIL